jgi:hypothetical protein
MNYLTVAEWLKESLKQKGYGFQFQDFGKLGRKKYLEGNHHAIYSIFIFNSEEFLYPNL